MHLISWIELPPIVHFKIFANLNAADVCSISQTCTTFRNLLASSDGEVIWKNLYYQDFGNEVTESDTCWKLLYQTKNKESCHLEVDENGRISDTTATNSAEMNKKEETKKESFYTETPGGIENADSSDQLLKQMEKEILEESLDYKVLLEEFLSPSFEVTFSYHLSERLMEKGIPLKFLGFLRSRVTSPRLKSLLLVEMLTATFKERLIQSLQNCTEPLPFVVFALNQILDRTADSVVYYDTEIKPLLRILFPLGLSESEASQSLYKYLNPTIFFQLIRSIKKTTGIDLTFHGHTKLLHSNHQNINQPRKESHSTNLSASLLNDKEYFLGLKTASMIESPQRSTGYIDDQLTTDDIIESSLSQILPQLQEVKNTVAKSETKNSATVLKEEDFGGDTGEEWIVVEDKPTPKVEKGFKFKWFKKKVAVSTAKWRNSILHHNDEDKT